MSTAQIIWSLVESGVLLLAIGLFVAAMAAGPHVDDLDPYELHHLYWSAPIAAICIAGGLVNPVWNYIGIPFLVIALDDGIQHAVQRWWKGPSWRSPLHRVYALLYRIPAVRWLNARLDDLLDG